MGFSRQKYWSGLSLSPPVDLPDPGIKPVSLTSLHWQTGSLSLAPPGKPFLAGEEYKDQFWKIPESGTKKVQSPLFHSFQKTARH